MTLIGIMRVLMMIRNTRLRPRKRYLESANAAMLLMISVMRVAPMVTTTLLRR
jgi:hypothetical protein